MRELKWLLALVAVFAVGLIAAGCGDDDSTSTSTTTSTAAESTTEDTSTTEETTPSDDSESSSPDDVYNACIDVIEGTPAEDQLKAQCGQARNAFEQCQAQAEAAGGSADQAIGICQDAADQAVKALQAAG